VRIDAELRALREMKRRVRALNATVLEDLRAFQHTNALNGFVRLPDSPQKDKISITTTCTSLMALAATGRLAESHDDTRLKAILQKLLNARWESSKLDENNAFTSVMILRTLAMLVESRVCDSRSLREMKRDRPNSPKWAAASLAEIAKDIGKDPAETLRVSGYPASATIAYWFADAVAGLDIDLGDHWAGLIRWATSEFGRQVSRTVAGHDAIMDPVAMMMAACLLQ
jgi:hypothetical protein